MNLKYFLQLLNLSGSMLGPLLCVLSADLWLLLEKRVFTWILHVNKVVYFDGRHFS